MDSPRITVTSLGCLHFLSFTTFLLLFVLLLLLFFLAKSLFVTSDFLPVLGVALLLCNSVLSFLGHDWFFLVYRGRGGGKSGVFSLAITENLFEVKSFALLLFFFLRNVFRKHKFLLLQLFSKITLFFLIKFELLYFWSYSLPSKSLFSQLMRLPLFVSFLFSSSCMSCIVFLVTKFCFNTDDFHASLSVDRERNFSFRS